MFSSPTFIFLFLTYSLSSSELISLYDNAQFDPMDIRFKLVNISSIESLNVCICACYNEARCFTANYFGIVNNCLLYVAQLWQGQLSVLTQDQNATVIHFKNRSLSGVSAFNRTNETVYGLWNTSAGLDGRLSSAGTAAGNFWSASPPRAAFDNNLTSVYISYGECNTSSFSITCGINTGFYLAPQRKPSLLLAFRISTGAWGSTRDPLAITIEGSNQNGTALMLGSSWTLMYNGTTGLVPDPGRKAQGIIQQITNNSMWFLTYRFLVTKIRGNASSVEYSEVELFI